MIVNEYEEYFAVEVGVSFSVAKTKTPPKQNEIEFSYK